MELQNERYLEERHEAFDEVLAKGDLAAARAIIDEVGEKGFEGEALFLHNTYNRVTGDDFVFEAYEHDEPLPILPEEDDAPSRDAHQWRREGDEKFPVT